MEKTELKLGMPSFFKKIGVTLVPERSEHEKAVNGRQLLSKELVLEYSTFEEFKEACDRLRWDEEIVFKRQLGYDLSKSDDIITLPKQ